MELHIHTDGGARSNPGPAGVGVVYKMGEWTHSFGKCIGTATNNVAEYTAVIEALTQLPHVQKESQLEITKIAFFLDSQLVVCQIIGTYKVKETNLQILHKQVLELLREINIPYTFTHIPRAQNAQADKLYNDALDNCP